MRQGRECSLLKEKDQVIGVNLGSDFCAEHEWGIDGIKRKFGINLEDKNNDRSWWEKLKDSVSGPTPVFGIDKRRITKGFDNLAKFECTIDKIDYSKPKSKKEKLNVYCIVVKRLWDQTLKYDHYINQMHWREGVEIFGFWNEEYFLIGLTDEKLRDDLYSAFEKNDIAIWLGGGGVFQNARLVISIVSRLPKETIDAMEEIDRDHYELKKEAVNTGIYDTLKKAGKTYYALSPRWKDKSKTEVVFWLNPEDQKNNNHGWYSVKDLEDWANDRGPIPMKKEKA